MNSNTKRCIVAVTLFSLVLTGLPSLATAAPPAGAWSAAPMDWPHWRGPEMNGVSREKNLVESWTREGENLLWKRDDLGSRSTPITMNGKLYTICRHKPETPVEAEKVVCVDAATGETIWEQIFNVYLSDVPDTRVGWSSVVGDPTTGNVFAMGVCGYFLCLNGETGEILWSHSLHEEYGLLSTYGGRTNFPIVHDDFVIVSAIIIGWGDMAKPCHRFIAFDKRNGLPVWFEGTRVFPYDTTYSSPIATVINGTAAIVFGSGDGGVHAFQPLTGKSIWSYDLSRRGINTSPLIHDNTVFIGHGEENINDTTMGSLIAIDATKQGDVTDTAKVWQLKEMFVGKSTPVMVDGKLVVVDDKATFYLFDPKTGEKLARKKLGTMMRSSPLFADGKIYTCDANGRWFILKIDGNKIDVVHKMRLNREESYGSPIASHGRVYVPTTMALYCIGNKDQEPSADDRPAWPEETAVSEDTTPAQLQVVPVEQMLKPGQRQQFQVRLFNARGQYLKTVDNSEVKYTIEGPGEISEAGKYSSSAEQSQPVAVTVKATVGELSNQARVRVIPGLPWKFDFNDGKIPETWVGIQYRHVPVDFELLQSLQSQNPLAADLYIYLHSSFVNSGLPALKYDNSTPKQGYSELLRFLGIEDKATSLGAVQQPLDPALQLLKDNAVIASWKWAEPEGIGAQLIVQKGDHKIGENGAIMKIKTIPKGTRSQGWMGWPDLKDYTVQADVLGNVRNGKMPDIGLIGQRYAINLMGAAQQVQISTWHPQLRMASTEPFAWEANVWYTMKMKCQTQDGKAVLQGKVWKRGEEEPAEWMITATDESPNEIGSPGLFGNATDAEVFYDNYTVTPNP